MTVKMLSRIMRVAILLKYIVGFATCFAQQHSRRRDTTIITSSLVAHSERKGSNGDSRNVLSSLTFQWAQSLIQLGNLRPLEVIISCQLLFCLTRSRYFFTTYFQLSDLWQLEKTQQMSNVSEIFEAFYEREVDLVAANKKKSKNTKKLSKDLNKSNFIETFLYSPLYRSIAKMYHSSFAYSGILKLFNTIVQFVPSLLVARILKLSETLADSKVVAATSSVALNDMLVFTKRREGIVLSLLLLAALCAKTIIENQYFHVVTEMAASVRGAVSSAVYRKSLRLSPSGRQNSTIGEIVNYMQLDTARIEQVASSVHILWDGLFQVVGYTCLLLHFLGPSVFAGIAGMLVIIPLQAIFYKRLSHLRGLMLKHTDNRVKLTNEVLQGVRAIKSYNWESAFKVEKVLIKVYLTPQLDY